jgi:protein ImuA
MQNVISKHGVKQRLAALRASIEGIEKRPLLADSVAIPANAGATRDWLSRLAAPSGLLQEIYADEVRDGGAALGFALGMARALLGPHRPAVLFMQLLHDGQELGLPYGAGLLGFGMAPETLLLGRLKTVPELLWAIEEAVACRAVAAVVAEISGTPKALDFTASRRLSLRAAQSGASVFMLRRGRQREASAARLRWHISPAPSQAPPFDNAAPGPPRWLVVLEKGGLPQLGAAGNAFLLDWTEHGFALADEPAGAGTTGDAARPASPGIAPAALGDRKSEAG